MESIIRTKEELQKAKDEMVDRLIIQGELAEKLNNAMKIKTASKWSIGLLVVSLDAVPFTGGLSAFAVAPIAALTGIDIVIIIIVASLGIGLIMYLAKNYKKVSFRAKGLGIEAELILERDK